jgi:dihydrofolate reductase
MKRIIAALQVTLDGKIEGPNGELDWIGTWGDDYGLMERVDTCVLGAGMWPGYRQYWTSILADPTGVLELTGRRPDAGEIEYARWADRTPHVVVSTTMTDPEWATARVVRDLDDIAALKQDNGADIHAVGGATLVSNLMNRGLVDELHLVVHPLVLGPGTALFKDVADRHALRLESAEPAPSGHVVLTYLVDG